jgi:hypothetical protein
VHVAPACAGFGEGSDHFGLIYVAFPYISVRGCFQDLNLWPHGHKAATLPLRQGSSSLISCKEHLKFSFYFFHHLISDHLVNSVLIKLKSDLFYHTNHTKEICLIFLYKVPFSSFFSVSFLSLWSSLLSLIVMYLLIGILIHI